jgi:hypothetical protein
MRRRTAIMEAKRSQSRIGGIALKKVGERLFCSSLLLLLLVLLAGHRPARAAGVHAMCSNGGFDFNDTSPDRAKIPGTGISVDTLYFENHNNPLAIGNAVAFESGKQIYYLRDSTDPEIPLPAHLDEFFRVGDLVVVGGCEGNGGHCGGWLFLLKIENGKLKLLDTWEYAYLDDDDLSYDFFLEPASRKAADGGALFRLDLYDLRFSFYVKATHERFAPDFDSSAYRSFCESTDKLPIRDLRRLRQSCVCTFFLEKDKEKAREESKSKINRYYGTLIRKARTFPDRRMNYEQYHEYLSPRLSKAWEYQAIADAFEGPRDELAGPADLMTILNYKRQEDIEDTMKISANFSRIGEILQTKRKVSLVLCDGKGGAR